MPSRRSFLSAASLLLSLAALSPVLSARASMVEAVDLDTLVRQADDVVLARVIKQWTQYDDKRRIVTDFQMQVERVEKGSALPGSAIVVRRLGGIIGDRGMRISGEPSFTEGEVVLVFGTRGKNTYLRPVGMGQGTLRVFEQDGERWVRSDASGMTLVQRGDTKSRASAAVNTPRKLRELLADVHEIVLQQQLPVAQ
ncbi:MAG: hypothetical protein JWN48_4796 [Myxococcaceae bacterium]|nr:hypothetical protein [Myxococcaceae bacterium]